MAPRLGVIVPYRDRAEHLAEFIPALTKFLTANTPQIPARILVVEQAPGLPFNQGLLQNVGFVILHQEIDYLCLHDVDTLPEHADYSWPDRPSMLVFHGLPHPPEVTLIVLSGVVLVQKAHFLAANGYSNEYWDWGFEDVDFRERLLRRGLKHVNRGGTYRLLPHRHRALNEDGSKSGAHDRNQKMFVERWYDRRPDGYVRKAEADLWTRDGLNTLPAPVISPRRVLHPAGEGRILVEHVGVAPQAPKIPV